MQLALVFKINELLAKLMAPHEQYEIFTSEIHHTEIRENTTTQINEMQEVKQEDDDQ